MNLHTLKTFRHAVYHCVERAGDALFTTIDALRTDDRARSFPERSLSPSVERRWPSLSEAFEDGRIDETHLKRVRATSVPSPDAGQFLWTGAETTGMARPQSVTGADRSAQDVQTLPECDQPVTSGWQWSTLVALPHTPSRWTSVLDQQRVSTDTTAAQVGVEQLTRVCHASPARIIGVLDRASDSAWVWCQLSDLPLAGSLVRVTVNRCFSRPAPSATGTRGAPRTDGDTLQPTDPLTHEKPSGVRSCQDDTG